MKPEVGECRRIAGLMAVWRALPGDLGLWVAVDPESLLEEIDEESFQKSDERLPYFATLWASALALCPEVLALGDLRGQRVLDLGCGLGATGLAAAAAGATVDFLDWEPRALAFVQESAEALDLAIGELFSVDWRKERFAPVYDLILGTDVLYEERLIAPVAALLHAALKPSGQAWITDPERQVADRFAAIAREQGLRCAIQSLPHPESAAHAIRWHRVQRAP